MECRPNATPLRCVADYERELTFAPAPVPHGFIFDRDAPRFHDFLEWHGLYKVWLNRERAYRERLRGHSLPEQLRRAFVPA